MANSQWFLIESEHEYTTAFDRYQVIKGATKESSDHKEKLLLVHLLAEFEEKASTLPEVDPIETIKIRMEDFSYKAADLARVYGDKGTVSKVLNYKQPLSLEMIRKFTRLLHISANLLIREYPLKQIV